MSEEIELKLELPHGAADRLIAQLWPSGNWQSLNQSSVYFDTPAGEVRQCGFTLRVRTIEGRYIQTVKSLESAAGLFQRGEWEHEINGPEPDRRRLRHTPLATLDGRELRPIIRSDVVRSNCLMTENGSEVELALDKGSICAGTNEVPILELEIELVRGDPAEVVAIAHRVAETVPVRLGVLSKAERGFALADGRLGKVVKAEHVPVLPEMTVAQGFAAIVAACLRHFRLNEPMVISERLPEALHQARVAMRRLRSALSLFRTAIDDSEFLGLSQEVRWFTGELGEARNLDVYLERKFDPDERRPIEERREAVYERVIAAMESDRVRTLLLNLAAWSVLGEWREKDNARLALGSYARGRIDRLWHSIAHAGDLLAMDEMRRHRLRIQVKKLRYALEFMEALYTSRHEKQRKFSKAVEELQEALGHLNDFVVARTLVPADVWPIEPSERTVEESATLEEAEHALERLLRIGSYWHGAG